MILLDANLLLRLTNRHDPEYRRAQRVVFRYRAAEALAVAPQSLYEFWAVATRSRDVNGMGMEIERARSWIGNCLRMFPLLPEPAQLVRAWVAIVEKYGIKGFRAHDARYVALMQLQGLDKIMTYNVRDFAVFPIKIIDPRTVD